MVREICDTGAFPATLFKVGLQFCPLEYQVVSNAEVDEYKCYDGRRHPALALPGSCGMPSTSLLHLTIPLLISWQGSLQSGILSADSDSFCIVKDFRLRPYTKTLHCSAFMCCMCQKESTFCNCIEQAILSVAKCKVFQTMEFFFILD